MRLNPVARIPWATSTMQNTKSKSRTLKVLTLCQSAKVKQRFQSLLREKTMQDLSIWLEKNGLNQFLDFTYAMMALSELKHSAFGMQLLPGWEFKV